MLWEGGGDVTGDNGIAYTYPELEIHAKISTEEMRPMGLQLYALLGLLYIPLVVDTMWFHFGGSVELVKTVPEKKPPPGPLDFVWDCYRAFSDGIDNWFLIAVFHVAFAILFLLQMVSILFFGGLVNILFFIDFFVYHPLKSLLRNLFYALSCRSTFENNYLSLEKKVDILGDQHWALTKFIPDNRNEQANLFVFDRHKEYRTPPFPVEHVKDGDKFNVGFGPFESMCLFRGGGITAGRWDVGSVDVVSDVENVEGAVGEVEQVGHVEHVEHVELVAGPGG